MYLFVLIVFLIGFSFLSFLFTSNLRLHFFAAIFSLSLMQLFYLFIYFFLFSLSIFPVFFSNLNVCFLNFTACFSMITMGHDSRRTCRRFYVHFKNSIEVLHCTILKNKIPQT